MKRNANQYQIVLQHDLSDCGVACLLTIIKHHEGENNLENLRKLSGTTTSGTTLLGLYQAAKNTGFDAHGYEANLEALATIQSPCILHVKGNHYVVYYGRRQNVAKDYIIGDPETGIQYLTAAQLNDLWQTKTCLFLTPNEHFKKAKKIKEEKRRWIIALIKQDAPLLIIAAALGVVIAALGLVMAIFSQRLIDEILPKRQINKLMISVALVLILLLVKEVLSVLRQYFLVRQSKDFNVRITDFFYTHLLRLPKSFFDSRKIGELTARLNDTTRIQRVISQLAGNLIIDGLMAAVATGFVFFYSWQVGIGFLVASPFFFVLIRLHNTRIINGHKAVMTSYAVTEANYISTLQGIEIIKNYNKQPIFSTINKKIYQLYQDNIFSLGMINIKLSFLANAFGAIFLISVLSFTSYQVLGGHLKTGELIAILGMCGMLLPSVANLALVSIPINEAKIAFDRMFEFTSSEVEKAAASNAVTVFDNLQVKNITFRFAGRLPTLKNTSFEINRGEIIAIIGENGCGKSTLTQILQKHYANEKGEILINHRTKLNDLETTSWRKIIGSVPQNIHIFNGTLLENIAFDDAQNNLQQVIDFLNEYGFSAFVNSLPQGAITIVGEEGINLSGGQKQMVALARALYLKPQLLILDEATSAMDRQSEQFVMQLLHKLKSDMGVIFITHRLHLLKSFCNRIYILEKGATDHYGSHEDLLNTENMYSVYWNSLLAPN
jgi:ABC-type bacteriocin/lantibiotic exporter with double-glycine peptidase domain